MLDKCLGVCLFSFAFCAFLSEPALHEKQKKNKKIMPFYSFAIVLNFSFIKTRFQSVVVMNQNLSECVFLFETFSFSFHQYFVVVCSFFTFILTFSGRLVACVFYCIKCSCFSMFNVSLSLPPFFSLSLQF